MRGLDGKVAVVTGGGNGIGRACCLRFADEGMDVLVADILEDHGAKTVAEIEATGRRGVFVADRHLRTPTTTTPWSIRRWRSSAASTCS